MDNKQKESILVYGIMLFILSICNFAYVKYTQETLNLDGHKFKNVGLMEYKNNADGAILYIPVFKRMK